MKIRLFLATALAVGVMSIAVKAGELPRDRAGTLTRAMEKPENKQAASTRSKPKKERTAKAERSKKSRGAVAQSSKKKSQVALVARKRKAADAEAKKVAPELDKMTTAAIATASKGARGATDASAYSTIIARYASEYSVPVQLAHAVIQVESNYRPGIVGSAGEIGLMQIKPATARMMGYSGSVAGLHDPDTNIRFGMMYLSKARELGDGTTCGTILKYNAGHAATRMNPISSSYCAKVTKLIAGL